MKEPSKQQQQQEQQQQPLAEEQQQQQQSSSITTPPPQQQPTAMGMFMGSASQTAPIPLHVLDQEYDMLHQVGGGRQGAGGGGRNVRNTTGSYV